MIYSNKFVILKLILSFTTDINLCSRTVNFVWESIGQKIGSAIIKDIGEKQVKEFVKRK